MKALSARTRCLSPASSARHSSTGNDARDDVERNEPLGAGVLAVHGERDADAMKQRIRFGALVRESLVGLLFEPVPVAPAVRAGLPVRVQHLVVGTGGCLYFEHAPTRQGGVQRCRVRGFRADRRRAGLRADDEPRHSGSDRNGRTRHLCTPLPLERRQMRTPCQPRLRRRLNGLRARGVRLRLMRVQRVARARCKHAHC